MSESGTPADEASDGPDGLLGKAVRQSGWSTLGKIGGRGFRFLILLGLARLLVPEHFGVLTEAQIFTSLLGTVAALGLEPSLIQSDEVELPDFSTVLWTTAVLALALVLVAAALGPLAAWIFDSETLTVVLPALAISPALNNVGISARASLRRSLDYRNIALASITGTVAGGGAALGLAVADFGVWALVAQMVVASSVTVSWLWLAADVDVSLCFSRERLSTLTRFGGPYTGEQILNFVNRRADDFVIGVFLGDAALGFYRIAYAALKALTEVIGKSLNAVALPIFARVVSEESRLRSQFLRATELAALLALPACAGFALVADAAIPVLFGSGWTESIPAARVLSFVAFAHSVVLFSATAMYAQGRSDLQLRLTALYAVLNVIGFSIGVHWGILGVATAYALQNLITAPIELAVLKRLVPFRAGDYLGKLWRPSVATLVMAGGVIGLRTVVDASSLAGIAAVVALGAGVYTVALLATGPSYVLGLVRPIVGSLRT